MNIKYCKAGRPLSLYLLVMITGCIEPYAPPVSDAEVNYLVVDGFLDDSDKTAKVRLSRALPLASTEPSPPELNATIALEDRDGNTYPLSEAGEGLYQQSNLAVDEDKEYRLYIQTSDASEYRSDFVAAKQTPPIDSITWAPTPTRDGINIFVTTHDDSNNTRYYKWSFEETYEYDALYYAYLKGPFVHYVGDPKIAIGTGGTFIPEQDQLYRCWSTFPSQTILIGTSERLARDVIYQFPVNFIPKGSQKMIRKYSILVRQWALSRKAYDYWQNLQKTSEGLGSLFDPQPGQVTGNIQNLTNPKIPALGYFDAGSSTEMRLFIKGSDLPDDIRSYKEIGGGSCIRDTVWVADFERFDTVGYTILDPIKLGPSTIGYSYTTSFRCVDCRVQGGVTTRPTFWE